MTLDGVPVNIGLESGQSASYYKKMRIVVEFHCNLLMETQNVQCLIYLDRYSSFSPSVEVGDGRSRGLLEAWK